MDANEILLLFLGDTQNELYGRESVSISISPEMDSSSNVPGYFV